MINESVLIERRRTGRYQVCRLRRPALTEAKRWCEAQLAFWNGTLDAFEQHLQAHPE